MGILFTLAVKDLRVLFREKTSIFWVLGFPLMIALFFGTIFSGGGGEVSGMKIAVIDEDQSDYSKDYIEEISGLSALRVSQMSRDSAEAKVRQGKLSAVVTFKKGFGESLGMFSDDPLMEIGIDPARKMTAGYLQGLLIRSHFKLLHKRYMNLETWRGDLDSLTAGIEFWDVNEKTRSSAQKVVSSLKDFTYLIEGDSSSESDSADTIKSDEQFNLFPMKMTSITNDDIGPRSSFEITFPSSLLWALIGISAAFAVSIVKERTAGTFLRLRIAPISRAQILAGKGLAALLACISACIILFGIGYVFFSVRVNDPVILAIGIISTAFCFVGLSMLISVLGKTEESVGGAAWGILMVAAMTGGGMIPVMFMPSWLLTVSHASPVKWGILAIEGGVWRNFSYTEMMLPVGVLIGIGVVSFIVGTTILSKRDA
ncbi:MAG: ABC transporter permease [candidate division Zixibacteria bacterium]|nr:ABC transporter permease [candidate division Zixibacteria bacterium]